MKLIKDGVYYCGVEDFGRKIFDQLIPLPHGTTYNSYFIEGSKKRALIDTSYSKTIKEFIENLNGKGEFIDYIIANHAEGDHSEALVKVLQLNPNAKVVTNKKCMDLLIDQYAIPENKFQIINDGDEISLGNKTLRFHLAPWVHWPDTMFTHLVEDNILFTCDFLGAHITYNQGQFYAQETQEYLLSAKRYYAEIMMPFRPHCKKYLDKIKEINPSMICPSHGGVYKNPDFILDAYYEWTADTPKNKVVIPFVSMYQNTERMVDRLAEKLREEGVEVHKFDLISDDIGDLAVELVDAATVVFGASMVLAMPHPYAFFGVYLTNALRPNVKFMSILGSYGWGGNLVGKIEENTNLLQAQKLDYITVKGRAKQEDLERIDALAHTIAQKHKEIGAK
ncbi:TPA: FprA family A-type flavoprotein [Candidatus Galligastranaerophilus intestinavium]|uniref:FprA family A-type flavoprotein n=1 Tax=Candidatus Galligastranaerophilus intestinavium TaxID=2840836 RepID=A0A9D1JXX5_9BACT|nr:FprA family A-type flavoprotein [Candidatus Galligastranaerophilus intestinavium]